MGSGRPTKSFFFTFLKRNLQDWLRKVQKLESEPINIDSNELRVWMVGHATSLINLYGTTILTDPVLVHHIPFPKRIVAHGYEAEEFPFLDFVVVSHAHLDHFNKTSLKYLAKKTGTLIIPRNCKDLVDGMGFNKIVELDWNQSYIEKNITIYSYKVEHWGKRVPWEKRNRGYNCFVFESSKGTVFFGGDTGYGEYFKEIGDKHNIDVSLLPISAYNPSVFRVHHMDPNDALNAAKDLKTKHLIPIHWGNFRLSLESLVEPPELFLKLAKEKGMSDIAHLLPNGKSFVLPQK